jgi:hypothetical protein
VVKSRIEREREEAWKALASASLTRPRTDACMPYRLKATSATKLGAWELAELRKLLAAKDAGKTGVIGADDLAKALREMESRGRKLGQGAAGGDPLALPEIRAAVDSVKKPDGRIPWCVIGGGGGVVALTGVHGDVAASDRSLSCHFLTLRV